MDDIMNLIKENQFLLTAFGLSGAGLITFWIKDVPIRIFNFIKSRFMLSLEVESGTNTHKYLPNFIADEIQKRNFHTYLITNSMDYYLNEYNNFNNISKVIPGTGNHLIKLYNRFYILSISDPQTDNKFQTSSTKQQTTFKFRFYTLGLSKEPINILSKHIDDYINKQLEITKTGKPMIRKYERQCFQFLSTLPKRKMETVFMDKQDKNLLIDRIKSFYDSERWYYDMGIPYKLGIMLYGPPGTGKSSLIKALASYFNKSINIVSPTYIDEIASAKDENCFVVVEDIDTANISGVRERKELRGDNTEIIGNVTMPTYDTIVSSLSDVLNAMDGLKTPHEFIFIMTTNHIKQLDSALFRPGRIDILIEMGYANHEILKEFIDYYFPNNNIDVYNIDIRDNISTSKLQNFIINGDSLDTILNYCKKQEKYLEVV